MDDFNFDRPELSGSLIQMEFGKAGRIRQLWVTDPSRPDNGDNYQFILPSLSFGEEISDDYLPGTILLGARTSPDDPWILSRNSAASSLDPVQADEEDDEDEDEPHPLRALTSTAMAYEFPLLPEVAATGKFYERLDPMPHVVWDIEITNRGQGGLEIGELGFPLAFNNLYEGVARNLQGEEELWHERCAIHKFIAGSSSYVHVQRLIGEPPGLLVIPGDDSGWEFYTHAQTSIGTGFRWEGIPIVYIHSRAAVEREKWPQWVHGHSSLTLEQGETRRFQVKFIPTERDRDGGFQTTLSLFQHPVIRLWPGAVAPVEVGLTAEISGATPTQFRADVAAELDPDSYDGGGSCAVKPEAAGPLTLTFEDTEGRTGHAHLLFIDPIEDLIRRRAEWIVENQVCKEATNLQGAILNTDLQVGVQMTDPDEYQRPFGIVCSLGDALFLAEKNKLEPRREEVQALDQYVEEFLLDDLQNPQTLAVGHMLTHPQSIAIGDEAVTAGLTARLFETLGDLARVYDGLTRSPSWYKERARATEATQETRPPRFRCDLWTDPALTRHTSSQMQTDTEIPVWSPYDWDPANFWMAYEFAATEGRLESLLRAVSSAKAPTPSWWWYGSDKRFLKDQETPHPAMLDKGEMCLGWTTVSTSLLILEIAEREPTLVPDWMMRAAFGGLLGIWALVRPDGAAAMGYCPDVASRQYGMSWYTGDVGLALWAYLRSCTAHVYPVGPGGAVAFGCYVESRDEEDLEIYSVRPWDGVARRIVLHDWNVTVHCEFARILLFEFDARLRSCTVQLRNTGDMARQAELTVTGLWGPNLVEKGKNTKMDAREPIIIPIGAGATVTLTLEATE